MNCGHNVVIKVTPVQEHVDITLLTFYVNTLILMYMMYLSANRFHPGKNSILGFSSLYFLGTTMEIKLIRKVFVCVVPVNCMFFLII